MTKQQFLAAANKSNDTVKAKRIDMIAYIAFLAGAVVPFVWIFTNHLAK